MGGTPTQASAQAQANAQANAQEAAPCGRDIGWDIFCHVVDNYGDIGVCWRLACALAGRGQTVRLYVDEPSALAWMAPEGCTGVQVLRVHRAGSADAGGRIAPGYEPADVVIAAFGCALPAGVVEAIVAAGQPRGGAAPRRIDWIHLEYLSAESFVARSHGLASPVLGGAAAGVHRRFYFPGFTADTGGLLREPDLAQRRQRFDRRSWLASRGIDWSGEPVLSLFCYEPPLLGPWLAELSRASARLLVTHGRAAAAARQALGALGPQAQAESGLKITFLPPLTQVDFDHLLWSADLNFVRGEDSLVRALWSGAAFVWQAYPQDDGAHRAKLLAFLDWLAAPQSLRRYTLCWNGAEPGPLPPTLASLQDGAWRAAVEQARGRLLAQDDLVTRLLRFVAEIR